MFGTIFKNTLVRGLRTTTDKTKFLPIGTQSKLFLPIAISDDKNQIHNSEYLNKLKKNESFLEQIDKNTGLRNYLTNVYKKSGCGFATSLGVGTIAPVMVFGLGLAPIVPALWIANIPFSFYSIYKITKLETNTLVINDMLVEKENNEKTKWFNLFSLSNGLMISPAIFYSWTISPYIMPIALACTGGVFAASTLYALKKTDLSLVGLQGPLIGCVGGLICAGLVQLCMQGFGYHNMAWSLSLGTSVISTGIFSALIAVDTQLAIKSYEEQKLDSTGVALNVLLDATNLFLDLLKIIGEISKNFNNDD